jgi:TolC family type I secretion outer membrane protein
MVARKRIGLVAALTTVLAASTMLCSPVAAETLAEAMAKAYSTNPQLRSERAGLRATDEGVPQALSNWRPTVTVIGEAGTTRVDSNVSTSRREPRSAELEVSQPIYRGGRTQAETRRAEADVAAGRAQLKSTEQQILLAAVEAYMNVVSNIAVLDLARNNEQRLQRQLQAARDRFRVGEITRTDVSQAEAAVSGATAGRIRAEGALVNSRATYRAVIGDSPGTLVTPKETLNLPASEAETQGQAETRNPAVQRAQFQVESARHNVDLIRGELLPSVALTGNISTEEDTTTRGSEREAASLTAQLTVPLYQAGDVYSRLRAAKEVVSQRQEDYDDARRTALQNASLAWNTLETARAQVVSLQAQIRANEIALEGVEREALVGSRTVLDVLDAEQALLDSRVSLIAAQRDEVVARFALLGTIGTLTAKDLKLNVEIYDPERNYRDVRDQWFGADKPATRTTP